MNELRAYILEKKIELERPMFSTNLIVTDDQNHVLNTSQDDIPSYLKRNEESSVDNATIIIPIRVLASNILGKSEVRCNPSYVSLESHITEKLIPGTSVYVATLGSRNRENNFDINKPPNKYEPVKIKRVEIISPEDGIRMIEDLTTRDADYLKTRNLSNQEILRRVKEYKQKVEEEEKERLKKLDQRTDLSSLVANFLIFKR